MKRRTFLAAAIGAMFQPLPAPRDISEFAKRWAADEPIYRGEIGRIDSIRFIASPMKAPIAPAGIIARLVDSMRRRWPPAPSPLGHLQRIHLNAQGELVGEWISVSQVYLCPRDEGKAMLDQLKGQP